MVEIFESKGYEWYSRKGSEAIRRWSTKHNVHCGFEPFSLLFLTWQCPKWKSRFINFRSYARGYRITGPDVYRKVLWNVIRLYRRIKKGSFVKKKSAKGSQGKKSFFFLFRHGCLCQFYTYSINYEGERGNFNFGRESGHVVYIVRSHNRETLS